ncbi:hypothetical protein RIF29_18696 [Crotalaria pallida]|uniref:Uncharacterized protein n=1 Tax=Crotalaria pallida TaxID=3830 RepID=A0AAN9EY30_CROPI
MEHKIRKAQCPPNLSNSEMEIPYNTEIKKRGVTSNNFKTLHLRFRNKRTHFTYSRDSHFTQHTPLTLPHFLSLHFSVAFPNHVLFKILKWGLVLIGLRHGSGSKFHF